MNYIKNLKELNKKTSSIWLFAVVSITTFKLFFTKIKIKMDCRPKIYRGFIFLKNKMPIKIREIQYKN